MKKNFNCHSSFVYRQNLSKHSRNCCGLSERITYSARDIACGHMVNGIVIEKEEMGQHPREKEMWHSKQQPNEHGVKSEMNSHQFTSYPYVWKAFPYPTHRCLDPGSFLLTCFASSSAFGKPLLCFLCNVIPHLLLSSPHHISLTPVNTGLSHFRVPIKTCSQLIIIDRFSCSLIQTFPLDDGPPDDDNSASSLGLNTLLL